MKKLRKFILSFTIIIILTTICSCIPVEFVYGDENVFTLSGIDYVIKRDNDSGEEYLYYTPEIEINVEDTDYFCVQVSKDITLRFRKVKGTWNVLLENGWKKVYENTFDCYDIVHPSEKVKISENYSTSPSYGRVYWVNGYHRKDGTYVSGHWKTYPNETVTDNLSYRR